MIDRTRRVPLIQDVQKRRSTVRVIQVDVIRSLEKTGYTVHVLCVVANPHDVIERGVARELNEGKRYNRDVNKLCQTFDAFGPAIAAANGEYKVVGNSEERCQYPQCNLRWSGFGSAALYRMCARGVHQAFLNMFVIHASFT